MRYTVTFHALRPNPGEIPATVHRVAEAALCACTATLGMAPAAARTARGEVQADGFRVVCTAGEFVPDDVDRTGRGWYGRGRTTK